MATIDDGDDDASEDIVCEEGSDADQSDSDDSIIDCISKHSDIDSEEDYDLDSLSDDEDTRLVFTSDDEDFYGFAPDINQPEVAK